MKIGKKLTIGIVTGLITLLIVMLLVLNLGKGGQPKGPKTQNSITYYYLNDKGITVFAYDGKLLTGQLAGAVEAFSTVDGTVAAAVAGSGLYRVDSDGIVEIYPAGVSNVTLSLDNNYIMFSTASKAFIYDHKTGELTEIPDIDSKNVLNLVISPSGSTFGITVMDKENKAQTYLYNDGRISHFGSDTCIIAVSDDGSFAYYMEALGKELTGKLMCRKNGNDTLIAENASPYFELNNDLSEITFDINEKTHYSVSGSKAKRLVDASVLMSPNGCSVSMGGDGCVVLLRNLDTIFNCIYYTTYTVENEDSQTSSAYDLYYINKSHKATLLAEGASQYSINEASNQILCVVDNSLYKVSAYAPGRPELMSQMVYSYSATRDFKEIYVLDRYARLNYLNGSTVKMIKSNVSYSVVTRDGICLFLSDYESGAGTLQWTDGTDTEVIAEDVYTIEAFAGCTAYYAEPDETEEGVFNVFMSTDGKSFTKIVDGAKLIRRN